MRRGVVGMALLLAAGAIAGCTQQEAADPLAPDAPSIQVAVDAPLRIEFPASGSRAVEVHVRHADGSPASGYTLRVRSACDACTFTFQPLTQSGTETLLLTKPAASFSFQVEAHVTADNVFGLSRSHTFFGLPAVGTTIATVFPSATLAVGERRPFTAVAINGVRSAEGAPTFSMSGSAATVDANGLVTGVAPGSAVLTISHGGKSIDVALTVDATAVVGPPPEGVWRGFANNVLPGSKVLDHQLVLDSRGYPHAVVRFSHRATLLSWSGTGFGAELLPDALVAGHQAQTEVMLVVDPRDRLHIASATLGGLFVYEKQAGAEPGGWKVRPLGRSIALLDRAGLDEADYSGPIARMSLLAAPDGVEVLYAWPFTSPGQSFACGAMYRHAKLTDADALLSDVTADWADPPSTGGGCPDRLAPIDAQTLALSRDATGATEVLIPYSNRLGGKATYAGTSRFRQLSPGRWRLTEQPERARGLVPPISLNAWPLTDGSFVVEQGLSSAFNSVPYHFTSRGRLWIGGLTLGHVLRTVDPFFSDFGNDTPFGVWTDSEFPFEEALLATVWGTAGDDDRLHVLARAPSLDGPSDTPVLFSRRLPRTDVSATTPEASGRFLEDAGQRATFTAAPIPTANGGRAALAFGGGDTGATHLGRVLRSAGVDQPWLAGEALSTSQGSTVAERDGLLFAMDSSERLAASADLGGHWAPISVRASNQSDATLNLVATPGGLVADLKDTLALFPTPTATDAGLVSWPVPAGFGGQVLLGEAPMRNLFAAPGGAYLVANLHFSGTARKLYVAQVAFDGGTLSERALSSPDGSSPLLLRAGTRLPGNEILFPSYRLGTSALLQATTHRVDLESGAWQVGQAGSFIDENLFVGRLPDGRFVLGGTMTSRQLAGADGGNFHQQRVVLKTSADGLTWSAPRVVRPEGGDFQSLGGLSVEADGAVLLLITDNLGMTFSPRTAARHQLLQRVTP